MGKILTVAVLRNIIAGGRVECRERDARFNFFDGFQVGIARNFVNLLPFCRDGLIKYGTRHIGTIGFINTTDIDDDSIARLLTGAFYRRMMRIGAVRAVCDDRFERMSFGAEFFPDLTEFFPHLRFVQILFDKFDHSTARNVV